MKAITIFLSIILASGICSASVFKTTNLKNDAWPDKAGKHSTQISCFYNNSIYYYYTGLKDGYIKLSVKADNTVEPDICAELATYPNDALAASFCVYNNALYYLAYFSGVGNGLGYIYKTDKWYPNPDNQIFPIDFQAPHNFERLRLTSAALKDTLGLFIIDKYGKLYYKYMTSDNKWSVEKLISSGNIIEPGQSEFTDLTYGNMACVSSTYKNKSCYVLAITDGLHNKIHFNYIDSQGNIVDAVSYSTTDIISNVSLISGSVEGGETGKLIQCFYSAYTFHHINQVVRIELHPETKIFKSPEVLDLNQLSGMVEKIDYKTFVPSAAYFIDNAAVSDIVHKRIVLSTLFVSTEEPFAKVVDSYLFNVWNSDKLIKIKEVKDTTIQSFERLIGVIEGAPPFVLNHYSMNEISALGYGDCSSINLGKTYEKGSTSHNGFQSTITFKNDLYGIGAEYGSISNQESSYTSSFMHTTSVSLDPYSGELLKKVMLVPHFNKKTYKICDFSGNPLDTISNISCTNITTTYRSDFLSKSDKKLKYDSLATYMYRNIDFNLYNHIYNTAFQYVVGAKTSNQLAIEQEDTYTHNQTYTTTFKQNHSPNSNDSLGFFKLAGSCEFVSTIEINTTTKMGDELDLTLHCPGGDKEGEVVNFTGMFHWLSYTPGQNNWWVLDGYKNDKPWCMTYEIFSINKFKE
ncbi:MAG: hypothetical protein WCR42_02845 [bacterium]